MANTTPTYWDLDGISLNKYCWNITTLGGSRTSLPLLRGEDQQYANRPGKAFRPKVPDSRVVALQMWVAGIDKDDDTYPSTDGDKVFMSNLRYLHRLLWTPDTQRVLTRRWDEGDGVVSAEARVQVAGSVEPSMTGRTRADLEVPFLLSDPYFYGDQETVSVTGNTTVTNNGDASTTGFGMEITLSPGAKLTNTTPSTNCWVRSTYSSAVVLDVWNTLSFSGTVNTIGYTTHSGSVQWFYLLPGDNDLTITGGTATLKFRPPYV